MAISKKGILLVNLGTPDSPNRWDVYRYLKQFLLDKRVIDIPWILRNILVRGIIAPFRSGSSAKLYKELWTPEGSPLKFYGYRVLEAVRKELGDDYVVELAMRYQSPSIEEGLNKLLDSNISELTVFPMFPHYASASTGSVHEEVMRLLGAELAIPKLNIINSYYDHPALIEVFSDRARQHDISKYDHFVFSFHGLPQRQLKKTGRNNQCKCDGICCQSINSKNQFCYSAQCHATAYAIMENLGLDHDKCTISFQSRLGRDPWITPYTDKILEHRLEKGEKNILVFSPAFVADCLETTIEIGMEYKEDFIKDGGENLDLVESLNDDPKWIKAIAEIVA